MALKIITARSGYGKSRYVCDFILREAEKNPSKNYFVIVPDQFTMQTQMDFVTHSKNGGIMNIDVLSFSRLAHRIFEETGSSQRLVLDDTGKSLILRKIAESCKENMPIIGANMQKQGYIHEVKSAISEFMQYGVGEKELKLLKEHARAQKRKALFYKLEDLDYIYQEFLAYIKNHYITTEESMTLLSKELWKSEIIKDSTVVFDGFTGFTPVQLAVLKSLLHLTEELIITLTMDGREKSEPLFSFANETLEGLKKLATEEEISVIEEEIDFDITKGHNRFENSRALAHLEKNLFRYPLKTYEADKAQAVQIHSFSDSREEVRFVCRKIREIIRNSEDAYRDFAVIAADLSSYESELKEEFNRYEIPVFIDKTRAIVLNPFLEFLKAAIKIQVDNYSYDSVFTYLKTGMADFTEEEIDDFENYCLELNIRGRKAYEQVFARRSKEMKKWDEEKRRIEKRKELGEIVNDDQELDRYASLNQLSYLNNIRERFIKSLEGLSNKKLTVREHVVNLFYFLQKNQVEEKLQAYALSFENQDFVKQKEYQQVYGLVMELFDQMVELLDSEKMDCKELLAILEAGLDEIEVGSIPKSVDRVTVGDMERSRLKAVKHLFLIGANDGFIPKTASKGGIISDLDREFLKETEVALSPTPREQMSIQRYYLYLQLTKPSETLFLSYTHTDSMGNPVKASYLIGMILQLFPKAMKNEKETALDKIGNEYEMKETLASLFLKYAEGSITEEEKETLYVLKDMDIAFDEYLRRAFYVCRPESIEEKIAAILYGTNLYASISRMERFSACAYAHFVQYGLALQERAEYGLEARDLGSIFHATLEGFEKGLEEQGSSLMNFDEEQGNLLLDRVFEEACIKHSEALVYDSPTYLYNKKKMKDVMKRTVFTLMRHLKDGDFKPYQYEMGFKRVETVDDLKLEIKGRIDRLDCYEKDNKLYVKIIDYKSGNKDFSLASLYDGQQLQLVIYLGEAVQKLAKEYPNREVVPAAALYYRMTEPMVTVEKVMSDEAIAQEVFENLKMKGLLTTDRDALKAMDKKEHTKSDIIPLAYTKEGNFATYARVYEEEDLKMLYDFALLKVRNSAREIAKGNIEKNPYEKSGENSCTYCSFKNVCDFDMRNKGIVMRKATDLKNDEILMKIREEMKM